MSLLAVLLLAVALSLDAFAVAVASGCALRPIRWEHYCRVGGAFGFFQCQQGIQSGSKTKFQNAVILTVQIIPSGMKKHME